MNIVQKITIFILLFFLSFNVIPNITNDAYAKNYNPIIELSIDENIYKLNNNKINEIKLTDYQKKEENNYNLKIKQIKIMKNFGFTSEEIIKYLYPYMYVKLIQIIQSEEIEPQNAFISVFENTAKIKLNNSKTGLKLNKNIIFDKILYNLQNNFLKININKEIEYPIINVSDIKKYSFLRSNYKTYYSNSSVERKNNITLALKSLDGVTILPGETFSFNKIVGKRSEERGYMQAKIISNGKFIESAGGGVCQVSTTLYNAALLAGLEIIEVHSHSLKIGYVEPGFDAMVNGEVSDLKFKNNTDYPIIIATSNKDDICNISIYGINNELVFKREYESENIVDDIIDDSLTIVQPASKVKTSLLVYKDNELIEERLLRIVYYKPLLMGD